MPSSFTGIVPQTTVAPANEEVQYNDIPLGGLVENKGLTGKIEVGLWQESKFPAQSWRMNVSYARGVGGRTYGVQQEDLQYGLGQASRTSTLLLAGDVLFERYSLFANGYVGGGLGLGYLGAKHLVLLEFPNGEFEGYEKTYKQHMFVFSPKLHVGWRAPNSSWFSEVTLANTSSRVRIDKANSIWTIGLTAGYHF